ncbi:MAG TPA: FtsK/SpoIIIE domain-containing protein [Solirubrobacteraceae bacterium]|nr:FtsK/SpoIIIE domain-containing protein [Solirubrobacteraceae bacterium]
MRVVVADGEGEAADLELRFADEDATVGDLLDVLGDADGATGLVLDGRFCHADLALGEIGLYEGARLLAAAGPPSEHPAVRGVLELRVVAGLDAGRRLSLGADPATVGRDDDCDLVLSDEGVSRRHVRIAPGASGLGATVSDLGSINGTWVEGKRIERETEVSPGELFEAGDVALAVAPTAPGMAVDPLRQARRDGTIPFNRPPRARAPESGGPLSAPERPPDPERPRLSVVSAVGPLVLGLVLVIALHNILFALFMLLSPILVIGSWLENRRFARRTAQGQTREQAHQLARFRELVGERHATALAELRAALPDPAEILRRATAPDPRLWERRPEHEDFLWLMGGLGRVPFRPPLAQRVAPAPQAEEILGEYADLELAPVRVDLSGGGVVGLVGPREHALALARSLVCQAAVLHGPADLRIAVLTEASGRDAWDWAKWLPHARDASSGGSRRLLAAGAATASALAAELADPDSGEQRRVLAVLDSPALIEGRGAAGRGLLRRAEQISGIVLASSAERLPASCTTVVELSAEGAEATLRRPQAGELTDPLLVAGVSERTARECALALARFEDADLELSSGALPDYVELLGLLGLRDLDADEMRSRWARSATGSGLRATFALSQDGPFGVDLVADGPHGLIAGTTGAGKSELLRSLVAALASGHAPDRLNFVLIDYKGGSAFAQCAQLPHTVGVVTDLDEQLGERALQSLEAELRYRERMMREHEVGDLIEYGKLIAEGRAKPLPRLLVIIDEFATLAAELPEFIASLVGIAQRGRSLGVHLLLATQRPSGAVSENIRANTNIRICLRVNTTQESTDVIDSPAAAHIGRSQPGRAQVRLGPSELVPIQTALVSTVSASGPGGALELRPFAFPESQQPGVGDERFGVEAPPAQPSQLELVVEAAREAFADHAPPRRPWLPPLPTAIELSALLDRDPAHPTARPLAGEQGFVVPLGLGDDPPAQAQYPVGWNLDAGNLLLFGIGGSGTTTALTTLATALAELADPTRVHIYAMDFGAGELALLERLPNVGAVLAAGEHERQRRLLRRLHDELRVRRGLDPPARAALPRIVLLLDGYAGFTSEHSEGAGESAREELARVWADGSELGVHVAIAADRLGAVPLALSSLAQQRLAFQLAELADYAQFGIARRSVPRFSPGRAIAAGSGQVLQVARPGSALARLLARAEQSAEGARGAPVAAGGPAPVGVLPARVALEALISALPPRAGDDDSWFVPVGIGDEALAPVGFELFDGDHALIAGPSRSGKTTALLVVASVVARLYPDVELVGVALRRSALRDCPDLAKVASSAEELEALIDGLRSAAENRMRLLLIDDAEAVDDPRRALTDLLSASAGGVHALIAGRPDTFRALGHWSAGARRSRTGLLLAPDLQMDGALLGATLPRRPAPPTRPGCGYLVRPAGFELVQVAAASAGAG